MAKTRGNRFTTSSNPISNNNSQTRPPKHGNSAIAKNNKVDLSGLNLSNINHNRNLEVSADSMNKQLEGLIDNRQAEITLSNQNLHWWDIIKSISI